MKTNLYLLITLFTAGTLCSCIKDDYEGPDPNLPTRTLIVYLAGDNNLSAEAEQKIEALRQGWTWTGNKCLIYADSKDNGARLVRLRGGCPSHPEPYLETVREYGAENSASAKTFARVLGEVRTEFPADSYGLIFFSHGSGWLPAGSLGNPSRSLGWDDGTAQGDLDHAEMEIADFAAAIPDSMFDFIVFETCLTAGVEVAYELRGKADYMLASSAEIVSPGFTPIYPGALKYLCNTAQDTEKSLTAFGRAYMDYVNTNYTDDYRSATLSILDIRQISLLAIRMREMLENCSDVTASDIADLQHFDRPGRYGDTPALPRYFDLEAWVKRLGTPEQYAAFGEQLKRVVKWSEATQSFLLSQGGFQIEEHSGLTTYIPQPEFQALNEWYEKTSWYRATQAK